MRLYDIIYQLLTKPRKETGFDRSLYTTKISLKQRTVSRLS